MLGFKLFLSSPPPPELLALCLHRLGLFGETTTVTIFCSARCKAASFALHGQLGRSLIEGGANGVDFRTAPRSRKFPRASVRSFSAASERDAIAPSSRASSRCGQAVRFGGVEVSGFELAWAALSWAETHPQALPSAGSHRASALEVAHLPIELRGVHELLSFLHAVSCSPAP